MFVDPISGRQREVNVRDACDEALEPPDKIGWVSDALTERRVNGQAKLQIVGITPHSEQAGRCHSLGQITTL